MNSDIYLTDESVSGNKQNQFAHQQMVLRIVSAKEF
jgi:hypothetical protein